MKTFKKYVLEANISRTDGEPKSPDEKRFKDKHVTQVTDYPVPGTSDVLNGKTMKKDMSKAAGYHGTEDEQVYESVEEKKLTPAELKKREEVAQAIERDNPNMPMAKKMAIATATAKKVAESEVKSSGVKMMKYHDPNTGQVKWRKEKPEFKVESTEIDEAVHPDHVTLHPHSTKKNFYTVGKTLGRNVKGRLNPGEHISDSEVDDLHDMGMKVKHERRPYNESVEIDEAANPYADAGRALADYARKHGGSDKADFDKASKFMYQIGKADILSKGQHLSQFSKFFRNLDTDVRDGIVQILKKQNVMESIEEATNKVKLKGFGPDAAKGNMGNPSARAALKPKKEETKVEAVSADRLKFATSGSKTVQDYMKKKADQRAAMNKANDPNAAKKGYALSAVPPERAYMKARKKGMSTGQARDAMAALAARKKNMSGRLPEEIEINESHFKVGQKVECIKSGMTGTVIKVDPSEQGKYYTVKQDSGKVMKYAPDELKALDMNESTIAENAYEENEMMMRQLHFIKYACDEIMDYLGSGIDTEEWFQNKLGNVHSMIRGLHSYMEGDKRMMDAMADDDEEDDDDMNEAKRTVTIDTPDRLTSLRVSKDKPPFTGGQKRQDTVTDKSGAKHTPMSRARDLAQMGKQKAMQKEEVELEEARVIDTLHSIVQDKGVLPVKFKDGKSMKVDMQTANLLTKVHRSLNTTNAQKFADHIEKSKDHFMKMVDFARTATR